MSRLLRSDLDELDAYVTRIAEATGIPSSRAPRSTAGLPDGRTSGNGSGGGGNDTSNTVDARTSIVRSDACGP